MINFNSINKNKGFTLLPLIFFLLISQILILQGTQQLHHSLVMHKLKNYQDCHLISKQLNITTNACPPCPLKEGCND